MNFVAQYLAEAAQVAARIDHAAVESLVDLLADIRDGGGRISPKLKPCLAGRRRSSSPWACAGPSRISIKNFVKTTFGGSMPARTRPKSRACPRFRQKDGSRVVWMSCGLILDNVVIQRETRLIRNARPWVRRSDRKARCTNRGVQV